MDFTSLLKNLKRQESDTALSFAQQRLWLLDQLNPGNHTYNISVAIHLKGLLDVRALDQSLREIMRRHEALRTTFTAVDGQSLQVIASDLKWTLAIVSLRELFETERQQESQRLITESVQQSFDLASGPLLRAVLQQLSKIEHILLLTIHEIVGDDWSLGVLLQELATLYEAFSNGLPSPLVELPSQYTDFAIWQRECLLSEVLESQLAYWKQQLGGKLPILELPTDRPRPPVQTYRGARQSLNLPNNLSDALKSLSQQSGVTLFVTLLAAFKTLLYRYTGQEDIIVGSAIANRNQLEVKGLIGLFANNLVMRTNLSENPSFRELLGRVQEVVLSAYAHQDLPFEKLVEELQPERNLSHSPLFQVMFAFHNTPRELWEVPGLTITPLKVHSGAAKFDLTLDLEETSSGIKGGIEYNTDLFDATTIARMVGHFQTLLQGIVANPEQQISDLPLLTPAEQHQLLVEWNNTQTDYDLSQCLHQLFEAQVERSPDAVAVVFEDQQLTYNDLNQRANQLAHYLQQLGVGAEVLVGICVERSLDMIIGLLGILKAGGAYLSLDPAYPQERLAFILQDTQLPVLLTQQRLIKNLPESQTRLVCLDTDWGSIAQESQENFITDCTTNNLAYIIYTSGSTGQPKGVLVNHRNVVRLLLATESWYHFNQQDVFSLFHSIAFDFSVWELWGALLYGGKLVVIPYWLSRSPEDFYKLLLTQQVTVLNQTPSAFCQLIQAEELLGNANKLSLRLVIFGGEALEIQSLRPWFERHGDQSPQLVNMYGITETTVHVTYRPLTIADLEVACGSVIGRPISDLQVYLLDQQGQPVPIGVPGEMYIGGAGVARGYLNRPELTAQRFIPNSFSDKPNARLYKSGDQARYLPNGDIEYLGRIDHQVKVRGFRIELGEIETLLAQHPTIQQTVVTARVDHPENQRLVAYIVPHPEQTPTTEELRHFLKQKLPEYMVPSAFVFLDTLPLTSNGKIDRRALPAPDSTRLDSENTYIAPRDQLEFQLTKIWSEILGVQPIGVRDNFFELGGHSILAVKLFWQIEKTFNKNLPLAILFQSGTIEALAKIICQEKDIVRNLALVNSLEKSKSSWSSLVEIQPNGSKPPFFCIHGLGGEVLCFRELALHLGSDQPFYGLQPQGLNGKHPFHRRIEDMATHYIQEIQTLQPDGPYFLGGYSFGGIVAFEMARQLQEQGEEVGILAIVDSCRPGYSWQAPFLKRVFLHLNNIIQEGPTYLWQKSGEWSYWRKQSLQNRYKRYLEGVLNLPGTDKHLKIIDTNTQAISEYIFSPYLGRGVLLRTEDQNRGEAIGIQYDPQFGWGDLVLGGLDIHYLPGSHLDLLKEPNVQVLAETLRNCLTQAQSPKN
ncbi:non-ribosomal peptide synthetase [Nostoc sp.]